MVQSLSLWGICKVEDIRKISLSLFIHLCSKIVAENPVGIEHGTFHGVNSSKYRKYRKGQKIQNGIFALNITQVRQNRCQRPICENGPN
jgi:hypothetical protein